MPTTTITEALAELKVLSKRIEAKRKFVGQYLVRPDQLRDPLEKEGGSVTRIREELQAIGDLEQNVVNIHRAITATNLATPVSVGGHTQFITEWLAWRRDVAPARRNFLNQLVLGLVQARSKYQQARSDTAASRAAAVTPAESSASDLIVNYSERDLAEQLEEIEATLETLDGQLSLKNATTTVTW